MIQVVEPWTEDDSLARITSEMRRQLGAPPPHDPGAWDELLARLDQASRSLREAASAEAAMDDVTAAK